MAKPYPVESVRPVTVSLGISTSLSLDLILSPVTTFCASSTPIDKLVSLPEYALYRFWVHRLIVPIIGTMQKAITSLKYASLVKWLKQAREDQGVSMRELASRIDEPHSFVQKVEIMERRLDVFEYSLYCAALNLNPHDGLKFVE